MTFRWDCIVHDEGGDGSEFGGQYDTMHDAWVDSELLHWGRRGIVGCDIRLRENKRRNIMKSICPTARGMIRAGILTAALCAPVWLMLGGIVVASAGGCASSGAQPGRSALEVAKLAYVDGSLAYEVAMLTLADLDAAGLVKPAHRKRIIAAQTAVQQWAPTVNAALSLWSSSGVKPAAYDEARAELAAAYAEVAVIKREVRP